MKHSYIIKLADAFYALANEKDSMSSILKEISKLDTYKDRIEMAEKNFKHLSSGSSRIVYLTDENTVIKLAKNDKGIDQNKAEASIKIKSPIINKIIKGDKNHIWLEVDYLEKITPTEFEDMTSINFKDFGKVLSYDFKNDKESKSPKNFEEITQNIFYKKVKEICKKFNLLPGDIKRISSWGTKDKLPVLVDTGFTKEVYKKHYKSSS
jgi:hypothetical protein